MFVTRLIFLLFFSPLAFADGETPTNEVTCYIEDTLTQLFFDGRSDAEGRLKFAEMVGGYGRVWTGSNSLRRQLEIPKVGFTDESHVDLDEFIRIGAACGCDFTRQEVRNLAADVFLKYKWLPPTQ